MNEPKWLSAEQIIELHAEVMENSGGFAKTCNIALLESAINKPISSFTYLNPDIAKFASDYVIGMLPVF